ncbi:MAG TPA: metallophosphoesterase [Candidatus Acidoferrales bacterium]|nr:metallophosphoesterase [Candidatus Acidoferrales bacterium]
MPDAPFHIFRFILILFIICSQIALYSVAVKYIFDRNTNKNFRGLYLPLIFILVNLPIAFIYYIPQLFYHGFMRKFIMWPYYAYETLSLAILFAALIVVPIRLVIKIIGRVRKDKALRIMDISSLEKKPVGTQSRRSFIKTATMGVGAYTFAGSLHSIYTREEYKIENIKLPTSNLPKQLDGLRIAMISDVHVGMYMLEEDMLKYTEAINNLNPDIIFIPGDFVTSKTEEIFPFVRAFTGLKSKYGIYTCLGNHDFFGDPDIITEKVRNIGMKVLRNETEELEINGAKLMLSGVDDGKHANFRKVSFEATSLDTARIMLCHKPYYFETAVAGKFDIMLSGHTHGGQIVLVDFLGVKLTPAALASQYISGKYRRGDSLLYVSRGIGTVGLPVRVNCPPEITVFTLTNKALNPNS